MSTTPARAAAERAIAAWRELLSPERVQSEQEALRSSLRDMGEYRPRQAIACLQVCDMEQVQAVVRIAREHRVPCYPISTGKNWGIGSRQAVVDGCAVIDLSGMGRIRELNLQRGYAVVEPGVSQGTLEQALRGTGWTLNVTATCANSSILGNALDRGMGTTRQRTEDLMALEVVLGSGEVLRTGFWSRTPGNHYYRHGIGPDLLPLFCQSNFAIVTAGVIALIPRPEHIELLDGRFHGTKIEPALAAMQRLYQSGVLSTVVKIFNLSALRSKGHGEATMEGSEYQLYGTLYGPKALVLRQQEIIREELGRCGAFTRIAFHELDEARPLPADRVPEVVQRFQAFQPTCLTHTSLHESCDLDRRSETGLLLCMPVVPHDAADLCHALRIVDEVSRGAGVVLNAALNLLSQRVVDMVVTIRFHRLTEVERAHAALETLHRCFDQAGYFPYRVDVDHMDPDTLYRSADYIAVLKRLKQVMDPDLIIAPGRYVP